MCERGWNLFLLVIYIYHTDDDLNLLSLLKVCARYYQSNAAATAAGLKAQRKCLCVGMYETVTQDTLYRESF